ncbi:MAG TPA: hypothetical protein DEB40_13915 [Elusimicrobia bacterium]|nr:hypothetical protein [Elusimicrobiota bacterium]HBT62830.1 hypothetical protein [Elusimicrobiota bacterium]
MERYQGRIKGWASCLAAWALLGGAVAEAGQKHAVVEHEHLWGLAQRYYGNPYQWRVIAGANGHVQDPNLIYPGQILDIPEAAAALPAAVEASAELEALPAKIPAPQPPVEASEAATVAVSQPPLPEPVAAPDAGWPDAAAADVGRDALSVEMPPSAAGMYPSMTRVKAPGTWKADGKITEFEGREIMAGQGDAVEGKITSPGPVSVGDRFYVLRQDAAEESDLDSRGVYLQRVGVIEVKESLGKSRYRFLILRAGGAVELGDFIAREPL